jgi:DNA gyrase/topoisomerase IV subunit A
MHDLILPLTLFILGAAMAASATFFLMKRMAAQQDEAISSTQNRLTELETLLTRRTEEFTAEISKRSQEHLNELESVDKEYRKKRDEQKTRLEELRQKDVGEARQDGYRQAELEIEKKQKLFSISVQPYILREKRDGFLGMKTSYMLHVGYQYQLLVNGIPCFETHKIILQRHEESVFNQEVIERMTKLAIDIAEEAIRLQAGPASALIPRGKHPVIEEK